MTDPSWPKSLQRAANGEYVDEYELHRYLWKNYGHLRSSRDVALYSAAGIELKARLAANSELALRYRSMLGELNGNPEVNKVADLGLDAFEQQFCDRLIREHQRDIYINRCERCDCITASPIACACRWCGHHWYERRAEMVVRSTSPIYPKPKT